MRVGVVGAGGLGCPALFKLALLNARLIRIWDPDRLELGNLHRQILYAEGEVGRPKAELAASWLERRRPGLEVQACVAPFNDETPLDGLDLILDCSDVYDAKLSVNRACVKAGLPFVFAACSSWSAQVLAVRPGETACLVCAFGDQLVPSAFPGCAEAGAFGPLLGVVAARQVDRGLDLLSGRSVAGLCVFEGLEEFQIAVERRAGCSACGGGASLAAPEPVEAEAPAML